MTDIYIVAGARTAIGTLGGTLKDHSPTKLGVVAAKAAIERSGLEAGEFDNAVFGSVIPTESADLFLGRTVAIGAGLPEESMGLTVNRLCGSGAQAIVTAASMIQTGDATIALAGGAESMSRAPYAVEGMRFGRRMGDGVLYDWLTNTFSDPFGHGHMGCTAENVAEKYQISRERQDAYSVETQRRAGVALREGRFDEQIAPIEIKTRKGVEVFARDEYPRPETNMESLAKLKAAFREGGTVTAGNASGINDGAAAVVLAPESVVTKRDLKPMGRIMGWGLAGVPPEIMGIGPVKAVPLALERAGLTLADIDVIESNEAFAAQSLSVVRELGLDLDKTNVNGGAIAIGHPIGASGARILTTLLHEMKRSGAKKGAATLCVGGGMGVAMCVEAL